MTKLVIFTFQVGPYNKFNFSWGPQTPSCKKGGKGPREGKGGVKKGKIMNEEGYVITYVDGDEKL